MLASANNLVDHFKDELFKKKIYTGTSGFGLHLILQVIL